MSSILVLFLIWHIINHKQGIENYSFFLNFTAPYIRTYGIVSHYISRDTSQSAISRDIHYIQKEIRKSAENYSEHLFEIYRNTMLGLDETIKKLWATIDSPRTDAKERIKAIT
jgi:hypothetical protein